MLSPDLQELLLSHTELLTTVKLLRFPKRFSMGGLYIAPAQQPETWELLTTPQGLIVNPENQPINWQWLDDASGDIMVEDAENHKLQLKISTSAAGSLSPLENLQADSLHVLDMSRSQVMDLGLTHISHLSSIRVLELAYTPITDAGLGFIARLKDLESLGLTATNITSDGLTHLTPLTNLKELWLNGTSVGDEGIEALLTFQNLMLLGLSGTAVTDKGILELGKLKHLLRLYLFNTEVSEAAIEQLRKVNPQLRVKWKRQAPSRPEFTLAEWVDLSVKEKSGGPSNAADKAVKQLEPPRTIDKPGKYMNEVEFWDIIDLLNWDEEGNDDAVIEPLVSFLSMKKEEEICAFQEILCRKLYDIDGEAYAREIGKDAYQDQDHHFSRDWFLAARACAVANGQGFYEEILQDPSLMPKDLGFAALTAVAGRAFRKKTGKPLSYVPRFSEQSMSNLDLWPSLS